jgi:glucan 1,3-beta-glucosidase
MSADQSQAEESSSSSSDETSHATGTKRWIRGVNVGGWLMAERFITPYLFAINTCHLQGDLCWYPGQVLDEGDSNNNNSNNAYAKYNTTNICDPTQCLPVRPLQAMDGNSDYHPLNAQPYNDYPIDEWTLGQAFANRTLAQLYMERHWDTFVTYQDLLDLKAAGVTHMRVPLSYWIRAAANDGVRPGEPWIPGGWPYFLRFAKWVREIGGMEIWADLHGAPGSENGFDNSGQYLGGNGGAGGSTCKGWTESAENVERTVEILTDLVQAMADEGLDDVITGFGLLNEPFLDCDAGILRNYYNQGLNIVRTILGPETSVYVGDMFRSDRFNDGFWTDEQEHYKTYLDSHPYHVFFEQGRAFTPKQHIAYVCQHGKQDVESCCYEDHPHGNSVPAAGISRIMGEWSAAYDQLPTALTPHIMKVIATTGEAPLLNRTLSTERMEFMRKFVEAQMVTYEARDSGVSSGWLFWNFKME